MSRGSVMFFHAYPHQYAGAQRVVHHLLRGLSERGVPAWVTTPGDGPFPARLREDGLDVRIVTAPLLWRRYGRFLEGPAALPALLTLPVYWAKLAASIRRWKPAVVHCNDHRGVLLSGPAARLARSPLVWHLHGTYGLKPLTHFGAVLSDQILVVSKATAGTMPALERHHAKVRIFHNGIPPVRVDDDEVAQRSAIPRTSRRAILTGARINPDKGLDVLVRAAAKVTAAHPDVDFYVAGHVQNGYEEHHAELLRLRRALGLDDRVHFLGAVPDPAATWAAADVYCQPSRVEPFGLGILEAMSLRKPVVLTRTGGMVEIADDDRYAMRVPVEDPDALADGLDAVLTDGAYAQRIAAAGFERMTTAFSVDTMLDRLLERYNSYGVAAS